MVQKPEARFVASIHRHLPINVYREGMANPYRGGTPDNYYDGPKSDLWVEYKFEPTFPKTLDLINPKSKTRLSSLQQRWIQRRWNNGKNAIVIFGCFDGVLILTHPKGWQEKYTKEETMPALITRKETALWIQTFTRCTSKERAKLLGG